MLYKNTKVKVRLPTGNNEFTDIIAAILQGNILSPFMFIICLDNDLQTLIDLIQENDFTQKKAKSSRYTTESMTDAGYADDSALLPNKIPIP